MSAKNVHHDIVIAALVADGWSITADPLRLRIGKRDLYIDLAAEKTLIGAERHGERIAVEVQSFFGLSEVRSLQEAVGQYQLYRLGLVGTEPDRKLFLAITIDAYNGIFTEPIGQLAINGLGIRVLVFDPDQKRVHQWIN